MTSGWLANFPRPEMPFLVEAYGFPSPAQDVRGASLSIEGPSERQGV